jgi:hypothetical protein
MYGQKKTFEPMFRNGVECISGVLVAHDVVQLLQLPEQQSAKSYNGERSSMQRYLK